MITNFSFTQSSPHNLLPPPLRSAHESKVEELKELSERHEALIQEMAALRAASEETGARLSQLQVGGE